jgi:hypothetical protein
MLKKLNCIFLVAVLFGLFCSYSISPVLKATTAVGSEFAGGSGTEDDPYLVEAAEQLDNVRNYLDAHFKQVADIDLSAYSEGKGWKPIGEFNPFEASIKFTGVFDGNGYCISNLTINKYKGTYGGLFGFTGGDSTLKNISLRNVKINIEVGAGGLVGLNGHPFSDNMPLITNCSVKGSITGKENASGGLAAGNCGRIKDSYFVGEIEGEDPVGGLVGVNENGDITGSYAKAKVVGKRNAGGLLGENNKGNVAGSYFAGKVESESFAGGLIGRNEGDIAKCYARGEFIASDIGAGGLVGQNKGNIKDSYAVISFVSGRKVIGGLLGSNEGKVTNSYSGCQVSGKKQIGGLTGEDRGEIVKSYYDQNITGQSDTGKGRAKLTKEMMEKDTFEGWDFEDTWTIDEGKSYPYLRWQEGENVPTPPEEKYAVLIEISGRGQTDPGAGFHLFRAGKDVEITVLPEGRERFSHWEIDGKNVGEKETITIESPGAGQIRMVRANFEGFSGGDGTKANPYLVETAEQLDSIRFHLNAHFRQTGDIDLSGYSEGKGWEPIGNNDDKFEGSFDGNGYKITNLTINRPEASYVGLFGRLGANVILKNLILRNVDITGDKFNGGLVGGTNQGVKIVESCVFGKITSTGGSGGGLVGVNSSKAKIFHGYAKGKIKGRSGVGGLVGINFGDIKESYAEVDVEGKNVIGGFVGGDSGYGTIKDCYVVGRVSGELVVGGFVGQCEKSNHPKYEDKGGIVHCYAAVEIEGEKTTGGLVAETDKEVKNSYYDMELSGQSDTGKGMPKATKEMMQRETFEGWDFENVWTIEEGETYPQLRWFQDK